MRTLRTAMLLNPVAAAVLPVTRAQGEREREREIQIDRERGRQ